MLRNTSGRMGWSQVPTTRPAKYIGFVVALQKCGKPAPTISINLPTTHSGEPLAFQRGMDPRCPGSKVTISSSRFDSMSSSLHFVEWKSGSCYTYICAGSHTGHCDIFTPHCITSHFQGPEVVPSHAYTPFIGAIATTDQYVGQTALSRPKPTEVDSETNRWNKPKNQCCDKRMEVQVVWIGFCVYVACGAEVMSRTKLMDLHGKMCDSWYRRIGTLSFGNEQWMSLLVTSHLLSVHVGSISEYKSKECCIDVTVHVASKLRTL